MCVIIKLELNLWSTSKDKPSFSRKVDGLSITSKSHFFINSINSAIPSFVSKFKVTLFLLVFKFKYNPLVSV